MRSPRRPLPRVGTRFALCALVASAWLLTACQAAPDRDDDDDDKGNTVDIPWTTSSSGSGGMGTGGNIAQGGAGGSGGIPPTICEYPAGPYDNTVGATVSKYAGWEGYVPGAQQPSIFYLSELHDCDGTHGVDAILVVTTQYG